MKHLVKRAGHTESFDPKKVYASVYAACLAVRCTTAEAELLADNVTRSLTHWLETKETVTSGQIKTHVARTLATYHPDAALLYSSHRDIS